MMTLEELRDELETYSAVVRGDDWTGQLYQLAKRMLEVVEAAQAMLVPAHESAKTLAQLEIDLEKALAALSLTPKETEPPAT